MSQDAVNHPSHYTSNSIETIDIIKALSKSWDRTVAFQLGNCIKYISRYALKGNPIQDLQKARWYLENAISTLEE